MTATTQPEHRWFRHNLLMILAGSLDEALRMAPELIEEEFPGQPYEAVLDQTRIIANGGAAPVLLQLLFTVMLKPEVIR